MKKEILLLGNMTNALRAQEILQRAGVPARVVRLPKGIPGRGCGFGITAGAATARAATLLREVGVKFDGTQVITS